MTHAGTLEALADSETIIVRIASLISEHGVLTALLAGIILAGILAATMSTADSQLLASSSAFASDIYKPVIRKDATDHEMQWAGRIIVILISVVAFFIAADPNCGGIMALVECAWAGFGSAFGPVILLSLYWRRLTYSGAVAACAWASWSMPCGMRSCPRVPACMRLSPASCAA